MIIFRCCSAGRCLLLVRHPPSPFCFHFSRCFSSFFFVLSAVVFSGALLAFLVHPPPPPPLSSIFFSQLMVVALVQKCGREARDKGRDPPTNLGFLLEEFFDLYGNQLNYAATGVFDLSTLRVLACCRICYTLCVTYCCARSWLAVVYVFYIMREVSCPFRASGMCRLRCL